MFTKEQISNLLGILASSSIIGVGFALGGTIGAAVMAGIGINLCSNIIHSGSTNLKKRWLSSNDGILNFDIQRALARSFVKALIHLETDYFKLAEVSALPKDEKKSIKALFKELKEQAINIFHLSLEKAAKEKEVKDYLYGKPDIATEMLWDRINQTYPIHIYNEHFRNFFRQNLLAQVQFWFSEELKTDSKDCNKAWRAFQRLLLEGIQADVKAVTAGQDLIKQDLQILGVLKGQIDQLKNTIDRRMPNEPFQKELEDAVKIMQAVLYDIAGTAQRTEKKVDTIASDIKTLLEKKTEAKIPEIPDDIQTLIDDGWDLRNLGKYEDARSIFHKALDLATRHKHNYAIAKLKYCLAIIVHEWDKKPATAKISLEESLLEFKAAKSDKDVAGTLYQLGVIEIDTANLDQAQAYLSQALSLFQKMEIKEGTAHAFHQLGWIEDHRGHLKRAIELYDQALTYFLSIYNEGNRKAEKEAILGIAGSYQHKGLAYEHEGKVEDAESNYSRALDWYRKASFKPDIAKILYLLARLKFREAQYDTGNLFLDESMSIYDELGDSLWYARCLDLKGRLYFTLGQTDKASDTFELALKRVEKSGDYKEQEEYLNKIGHIYLEGGKHDSAKKYFERAKDLAFRSELPDGYAVSIKNLAEIAHLAKDQNERDKLLAEGIQTLEKILLSVQAEPRRAFIIGQIGSFYERMENFKQALSYYQKAKKAFESLSDIWGVANSLGSIARMKGLLGNKNEEFDTYRELKKLLDGTPYYDLIAGTTINLGEIQMELDNLDEAKILFEEAEALCHKYNLHYITHLEKSMERLSAQMNLRKPPELSFKQLLEELFKLVEWFPEAKDSIFRLWMWGRKEALLSNYRNTVGVKLMICQDDLRDFQRISEILNPYSDLCLQVVSSQYPESGFDIIPYPPDKPIFFECAFPTVIRL